MPNTCQTFPRLHLLYIESITSRLSINLSLNFLSVRKLSKTINSIRFQVIFHFIYYSPTNIGIKLMKYLLVNVPRCISCMSLSEYDNITVLWDSDSRLPTVESFMNGAHSRAKGSMIVSWLNPSVQMVLIRSFLGLRLNRILEDSFSILKKTSIKFSTLMIHSYVYPLS